MTTARKWILSLAVVTTISLGTLSSASAAPPAGRVQTRTVRVWDLDLTQPEDVQTLYGRVQDAAADLCRDEARNYISAYRLLPGGWTERCVTAAVDRVVRDVSNPLLAALHVRMSVARND